MHPPPSPKLLLIPLQVEFGCQGNMQVILPTRQNDKKLLMWYWCEFEPMGRHQTVSRKRYDSNFAPYSSLSLPTSMICIRDIYFLHKVLKKLGYVMIDQRYDTLGQPRQVRMGQATLKICICDMFPIPNQYPAFPQAPSLGCRKRGECGHTLPFYLQSYQIHSRHIKTYQNT